MTTQTDKDAIMNTSLVAHSGTGLDRARDWATIPDDERKRRAVAACRDHNAAVLQDLADAWLTLYGKTGATVSAHTRRNYRYGIGALVQGWAQQNLLRPQRDAGALWLREMEEAGLKAATIRVRLAAARTLYAALRWAGATDATPFIDAKPAKDRTAPWDKRQPFSQDEIRALLADLDRTIATAEPAARTMARYDRILILLGAHAGLRASEMMELRWADVDLFRRQIVVRAGKGRKRRQVVMSSSLAAAMDAIPDTMRGPHVLPYRTRGAAWLRLRNLTKRVDIPHSGLHRLRHAAGTRMMAETHDLQEVAQMLGHQQLDTARVYAKWANDTQRRTVGHW